MYNVGIVGASGLIGKEVVSLIQKKFRDRVFIKIFPKGPHYSFEELDFLVLCTPKDVSQKLAPLGLKKKIIVIDASSAFRKNPQIPLILPNVNGQLLRTISAPQLIACPNCVVSIILTVLGPLHKKFSLSSLILSTYQSASGKGYQGLRELAEGLPPTLFPHPYANNIFLHESPLTKNGYSEEEDKIIFEISKILVAHPQINPRCVRVPVFRAHSIAMTATFEKTPTNAEAILRRMTNIAFHPSPTPKMAEHREIVLCAPIRKDKNQKSLDFWVVGDQIVCGGALPIIGILGKYLDLDLPLSKK